MSRFFRRFTGINANRKYEKVFDERGIKFVEQYRTPIFRQVTDEQLESVEVFEHVFQPGDAYWQLSSAAYGDPKFWWVIASFNKAPTLSNLEPGTVIRIPVDLSLALELLD